MPHLQITEAVYCNTVDNDHQHTSRVLYAFVPNKSFGRLLDISTKVFIFLKAFNSDFSHIEVWFVVIQKNSRRNW